ncbi:hypothetical protein L2E82_39910 [Cichorium intybus]|uniref:Uncharacterized protein n=1 Tax=Cichorium intybus TaxID=13427 RepID=A0ACB9AJJ7_CICIN|nr:hypothetical protein L2E82_39910 [Cichorium intybus]
MRQHVGAWGVGARAQQEIILECLLHLRIYLWLLNLILHVSSSYSSSTLFSRPILLNAQLLTIAAFLGIKSIRIVACTYTFWFPSPLIDRARRLPLGVVIWGTFCFSNPSAIQHTPIDLPSNRSASASMGLEIPLKLELISLDAAFELILMEPEK